jgi:endoglycosylceramidase
VSLKLNRTACVIQQKEAFGLFVDTTFPGLYYAWSSRVDVNFIDFVRQQDDTSFGALILGARILGTLHLARQYKDDDKIASCRSMYSRCLQCLADLIRNPQTVKSDHTLGAAVMLAIYEMLDGTGQNSWLTHSRGITALFRHRGARAHSQGVGHMLLIAFRSFLVADALIRGEPCFLAEPEWRSIIKGAVRQEGLLGKGSKLGDLIEYSFHEITIVPGLVARTRSLSIKLTHGSPERRQNLMSELMQSRERLTSLHSQLVILSSNDIRLEDRPGVYGPIPVHVANLLAHFSLHGMKLATALLDRLILSIDSDQPLLTKSKSVLGIEPKKEYQDTATSTASDIIPMLAGGSMGQINESPDHLALSMGMLILDGGSNDQLT